ncbi:hypothetical protein KAI58_01790 [Candidatus Gracilibacteria bacterium]|nr:hypothetical protein [Candidatus Gracilibacteria bacterium]
MQKLFEYFRKRSKKKLPLPTITLPYNREIKKQQNKFLLSFVLFLILSGFYTYLYTQEKIRQNQLKTVLVFKENIEAPQIIKETNIKRIKMPQKHLPIGYFDSFEKIEGLTLIRDGVEKEILLSHNFQEETNPSSISARFSESFALTINEDWFESSFPQIHKNDRIDILVSNPKQSLSNTISIAQNLKVLDIQKEKNGQSFLVLNTSETEAQTILFSRGLHLPMQLLIRPAKKKTISLMKSENEFIE